MGPISQPGNQPVACRGRRRSAATPRRPGSPTANGAGRRGGDRPERDQMVRLPGADCAGGRRGERSGEAGRNERGVAGDGQQRIGAQCRGPVEPGQHAGERSLAGECTIGQHRQAERGEARRITIGADGDRAGLRREREMTRSSMTCPPRSSSGLSTPPSRRASPPARIKAAVSGGGVMAEGAGMGRATGLEPVTSRTTTWRSAN